MNSSIISALDGELCSRNLPPEPDCIQELTNSIYGLPKTYLDLLRYCDGCCGPVGLEPGWFVLWCVRDVINFNKNFEFPAIFVIGTNAGGEGLGFDTRNGKPWKIVIFPFAQFRVTDIIVIARDFDAFACAIGAKWRE